MKTALYRHFDADRALLYVGQTANPLFRLSYHASQSPWFARIASTEYEWFDTREEALEAEASAIEAEAPLFNMDKAPNVKRRKWSNGGAFHEWLCASGMTANEVAARLEVSPKTITALRKAEGPFRRTPGCHLATKIAALTDGAVPADTWHGAAS